MSALEMDRLEKRMERLYERTHERSQDQIERFLRRQDERSENIQNFTMGAVTGLAVCAVYVLVRCDGRSDRAATKSDGHS